VHKHHIIPKHMGGTDDPSNLVELSVEEHSLAHKLLYEEFGKRQDKLAWLGLSKQIDREEIFLLSSAIGGNNNKNIPKTESHKRKISKSLIGNKHSDETKQKISSKMIGEKNPMYGKQRSEEYKTKHKEIMKAAWEKRKK